MLSQFGYDIGLVGVHPVKNSSHLFSSKWWAWNIKLLWNQQMKQNTVQCNSYLPWFRNNIFGELCRLLRWAQCQVLYWSPISVCSMWFVKSDRAPVYDFEMVTPVQHLSDYIKHLQNDYIRMQKSVKTASWVFEGSLLSNISQMK